VLVLVAGVAVGLASALGGGSSSSALSGVSEVRTLFHGIPQHGNVLGSPSAPVTLVVYADLQCPYCRDFELQATPDLVRRYVRTGRMKLVFRPLAFIGPDSIRGRDTVIAAGLQRHLFEAVQLLYLNQRAENSGWLDDGLVDAVGAAVPGIDAGRLRTDAASAAVAARAQAFDGAARADGVRSTPTLLVGKSGGPLRRVDAAQLGSAIDVAVH
jgi:protein-disulfide isomerase